MLVNPWKAMRWKKVMLKIKDKIYGCTIFGISFIHEKGLFVSNILLLHNLSHSVPVSEVKHKSEFFKCEVCEKYFKSEDYLANHGTRIYNKCHLCGKMFKNTNIITKHFTLNHWKPKSWR